MTPHKTDIPPKIALTSWILILAMGMRVVALVQVRVARCVRAVRMAGRPGVVHVGRLDRSSAVSSDSQPQPDPGPAGVQVR